MKKSISIFGCILVSLVYLSCKKSADSSNSTGSFSFHGNTYTETTGVDAPFTLGSSSYNGFSGRGVSSDSKKYSSYVFFFSGSGKPAAGNYQIVSAASASLASNQVAFEVIDSIPVTSTVSSTGGYLSTGTDGATLKVTLSSAGKLSITLSSAAVAGTYYDNTVPTNTQLVPVSTTASGTFNEQ